MSDTSLFLSFVVIIVGTICFQYIFIRFLILWTSWVFLRHAHKGSVFSNKQLVWVCLYVCLSFTSYPLLVCFPLSISVTVSIDRYNKINIVLGLSRLTGLWWDVYYWYYYWWLHYFVYVIVAIIARMCIIDNYTSSSILGHYQGTHTKLLFYTFCWNSKNLILEFVKLSFSILEKDVY